MFHINLLSIHYNGKAKKKKKFNKFTKIKHLNDSIAYVLISYLGRLEFSSGTFILLVSVTRLGVKVICGKFN